jgi:hypothetical protein
MAWNSANNNLLAAGYGSKPAADTAPASGAAAVAVATGAGAASAFAQAQQGSVVGQGPLLNAPRAAEDGAAGSADGAAPAEADMASGCVALWSLKNQFYPVWSFTTKAGALCKGGASQLGFVMLWQRAAQTHLQQAVPHAAV